MTKYLVELPDAFDVDEMKLNGFELADRERAEQELQKTLSANVRERKTTDEIDEKLDEQRLKLNSVRSKEEAIDELRRTEALLIRKARARNRK